MRLNEIIMIALEWPCDQFDRFRDWLEAGGRARKARLQGIQQPPEPLAAMQAAFRTTSVEGGPQPRYFMVFKFSSLQEMQKADEEWRALTSDATH